MTQPNLYIFAIGGTGSRVIKSLMFLLASGIKVKANKIIPILIDPDSSNGDLDRTYSIIKAYTNIFKGIGGTGTGFFDTELESLGNMAKQNQGIGDYKLIISDAADKLFHNMISHGSMGAENKEFMNLLFSDKNLNSTMDIGFKGNPNIGSVVLNQLFTHNDKAIKTFASNFNDGDRIFIIGSIFGGTGAAGFPLVLKSLRNIKDFDVPNSNYISNSKIGALTVLPYFGVEQSDDNLINKSSFISKTRAALRYYKRSVNNQLDALYYLGDTNTKDYENNPGASAQKNMAHFIELAGALSIIDFLDTPADSLSQVFKEYGINDPQNNRIDFNCFDKESSQERIKIPLTKILLMKRYFDNRLDDARKYQPWTKRGKAKLDESLDMNDLEQFLAMFEEWLEELASNTISFKPFNLERNDNLKDLINGLNANQKYFKGVDHFINFDRNLNYFERESNNNNSQRKLLEIFNKSTEKICVEAFKQ